jgi:hypothetical protein
MRPNCSACEGHGGETGVGEQAADREAEGGEQGDVVSFGGDPVREVVLVGGQGRAAIRPSPFGCSALMRSSRHTGSWRRARLSAKWS